MVIHFEFTSVSLQELEWYTELIASLLYFIKASFGNCSATYFKDSDFCIFSSQLENHLPIRDVKNEIISVLFGLLQGQREQWLPNSISSLDGLVYANAVLIISSEH